MIGLPALYGIAGVVFAAFAIVNLGERRFGTAAFWGLFALSFVAGDRLGDLGNGGVALALVALAGSGALRHRAQEARPAPPPRPSWRLLAPALIIPAVTLLGTVVLKTVRIGGTALVDPAQATLVAFAGGVVLALAAAMVWLRPPLAAPAVEGARIAGQVGWAVALPQMLAALGAVFALAGVGREIGAALAPLIPAGSLFGAVLAYTLGMALLTMALGNAFAAFPVMMVAVGLPLLIDAHGGNPAVVGALGMLSGFCGTLLTPMAANFNLVPAALLGLDDRFGVIRVQVATALPLLAVNTMILYVAGFR